MKYPLVSIAIATLNSEKTLPFVLKAIKRQSYPKAKLEILIIDGGSKDSTLEVARNYNARIIPNPKVDLVFAKHIGYKSARGELLIFLDSDEVLENRDSIKNKCLIVTGNDSVKAVISSGYKKPSAYPDINYYINDYGDPFSLFMYRSGRDANWFLRELVMKYPKAYENDLGVIFDFSSFPIPPFIELISMGVMIDLKYVKKTFPKILTMPSLHIHLFYLLLSKGNLVVVMKGDPVIHYSAATIGGYLKKIRSRIKNNVYETPMGKGGFKGREKYFPSWYGVKKFLFIPYCLSVIAPVIDSIGLFLVRKKTIYLIHPFLCLYTLFLIVFYYTLKLLGVKIKLSGYGI